MRSTLLIVAKGKSPNTDNTNFTLEVHCSIGDTIATMSGSEGALFCTDPGPQKGQSRNGKSSHFQSCILGVHGRDCADACAEAFVPLP